MIARLLLTLLAVIGLSLAVPGQQNRVSIPEGPRHFIVLVDSSWSMIARSQKPLPPDAKKNALVKAENALASMLFEPGRETTGPWYRRGKDLLTVIHYGIDSKPRADLAYIRLRDANLNNDYTRTILKADGKATWYRFREAVNPKVHTNLNVLAWALPLGLSAAALPKSKPVQETFVILLNDAQMNDGSMVLEEQTLDRYLSPPIREKLAAKERLFNDSVRLVDQNGLAGTWQEKSFGEGTDQIVITVFKALPVTTNQAAGDLLKQHPLDSLTLRRSGKTLEVSFEPGRALLNADGRLRIQTDQGSRVKQFRLKGRTEVSLPILSGKNAHLYLVATKSAPNPLLGSQTFSVLFDQTVDLPSGSWLTTVVVLSVLVLVLGRVGAWIYYQAVAARHFKLWLPDYVTPFELPPLSQRVHSRQLTRAVTDNGEVAVILELPSPLIRSLLYSKATLQWDSALQVQGLSHDLTIANLSSLPAHTKLVWQDRPASSGQITLIIERPTRNGRNHRAQVDVRFLSLPKRPLFN